MQIKTLRMNTGRNDVTLPSNAKIVGIELQDCAVAVHVVADFHPNIKTENITVWLLDGDAVIPDGAQHVMSQTDDDAVHWHCFAGRRPLALPPPFVSKSDKLRSFGDMGR